MLLITVLKNRLIENRSTLRFPLLRTVILDEWRVRISTIPFDFCMPRRVFSPRGQHPSSSKGQKPIVFCCLKLVDRLVASVNSPKLLLSKL
jgi:hypothetical protein